MWSWDALKGSLPGCGPKLWQLRCAALSLRSPPQPPGQSHRLLHWGEGSYWLGGQQGPKSLSLFPILSLPEPLLQTLPGLHRIGSSPSYSSPPGNAPSGDRTRLVVAFELLSGIFSILVSGVTDAACLPKVPIEVVWVLLREVISPPVKLLLEWFLLLIFLPPCSLLHIRMKRSSFQVTLVWHLLPRPSWTPA